MARLTRLQKELVAELDELSGRLGLDYQQEIEDPEFPEDLTGYLKIAKQQIVRSLVVTDYLMFDEFMSAVIYRYYFGRHSLGQQLRSKKSRRFRHFILERLYLLQKAELVEDLRDVPKDVKSFVRSLNDLRNAMAHSMFPEFRRGAPTHYKGMDIFSIDGFRKYSDDRFNAFWFFAGRV